MQIGYASGAFDMFHIGHLNLLRRAKMLCDHLIVGVITDEAYLSVRDRHPFVPFEERLAIVRHLRFVDAAVGDPFEDKYDSWKLLRFDFIVKGDDWLQKPEAEALLGALEKHGVGIQYVPYTQHTSSSQLRKMIAELERTAG